MRRTTLRVRLEDDTNMFDYKQTWLHQESLFSLDIEHTSAEPVIAVSHSVYYGPRKLQPNSAIALRSTRPDCILPYQDA